MKRFFAILLLGLSMASIVTESNAWWGRRYYDPYYDPYYYGPYYGPGYYRGPGPVSGTLAGVGGIVNSVTGL